VISVMREYAMAIVVGKFFVRLKFFDVHFMRRLDNVRDDFRIIFFAS